MQAGRQHHNLTLAVLVMAALAYALQQTMIVPALPVLQRDLHTTTGWATWLLTGFLLSASVATPLLGKLGDQYGKERLLLVSLAVFLAGCVGAAAAPDVWVLIGFRVLQGAAGAIFPLSFSIVRDEFPHERIGTAIGTISAIFGIGGGLGIVLSGVLVDGLNWRWIFVVGAIPVALAIVLVWRFVPESPIKTPSKVDVPGALLLSGGLVCLLLAITEGTSWGWGSARVVGLFAGAALLLWVWGVVELRSPEPLVDMRMLAERTVLFTNLTSFVAGFSMYGLFILVPKFVETARDAAHYGFGASATRAGLYLLPGSATMLLAGPAAGLLGRRFGSKWVLAGGMLLIALGNGWLARWNDRPWQIVAAMVLSSIGISGAFAAMSTLITEVVRAHETGIANGMNTVARTVGGVVGAQLGAALLISRRLENGLPAHSGYAIAFAIAGIGALLGAVLAVLATTRVRARPVLASAD